MKIKISKDLLAGGLLAGAIVGAGIFSLPYAFAQVGLGRGLLLLIFFSWLMTLVNLMYADVLTHTSGKHNFVTLSKIHLGDLAEWFAVVLTVIQMILVMVIYLILALRFVSLLWQAGPLLQFLAVLVFWLLGSLVISFSLSRLAWVESLTTGVIGLIVLILFVWALPSFSTTNLLNLGWGGTASLWLAAGPLLFALSGRVAIAELVTYARKRNLFKIIGSTFAVMALLYFIFVLAVLAVTGGQPSDDTVSGLVGRLPLWLLLALGLMGLVSVWHAYIIVGFDINNILTVDLRWPKALGSLVVIVVPLLLYFVGWRNFFGLVSLTGGIVFALEGIFIITMWLRHRISNRLSLLKNIPRWWVYLSLMVLVIVFVNQFATQLVQ